MSGGIAVRAAIGGGGSPVLHERREEGRGYRLDASGDSSEGLGLDGSGGRRPQSKKKVSAVYGWR
tara:strand:- start:22062 stop:22256 length:195 start_codon:yes stop_codon:yes gene_type:complete